MNAERDYLNDFIFPQIKSYCEARFIEFTPIEEANRWYTIAANQGYELAKEKLKNE